MTENQSPYTKREIYNTQNGHPDNETYTWSFSRRQVSLYPWINEFIARYQAGTMSSFDKVNITAPENFIKMELGYAPMALDEYYNITTNDIN